MIKQKYVVHIANLRLYINMGLILTQIHGVIKFKQSRWLKPYMDICSELRSKSTDDFEKKNYLNYYLILSMVKHWKLKENISILS